eukprot:scaffold2045_cov404-Prasinococcus_capsulatus_cf.AAC.40
MAPSSRGGAMARSRLYEEAGDRHPSDALPILLWPLHTHIRAVQYYDSVVAHMPVTHMGSPRRAARAVMAATSHPPPARPLPANCARLGWAPQNARLGPRPGAREGPRGRAEEAGGLTAFGGAARTVDANKLVKGEGRSAPCDRGWRLRPAQVLPNHPRFRGDVTTLV